MLQIYNSLSRTKEVFSPIEANHVRMYVCGMTVYDYCHLGHARVLVVFDMVVRYLRASGYRVTYVRNITDIDDKIIRRACENGEDITSLTARFIRAMHEDTAPLGVLPPDAEPRATEHIAHIQDLISALLDNGYAYVGENGDVYYDVSRFRRYGALSGKQLEDLRAGARVEVDEAKHDPPDFVLWKAAKAGEPSWDSPWGSGRPGWHIECSAMSTNCLGNHFDIHGGGMDLMFPHHENEIAQSAAATGETFVNTWMHIGFVQIDQQKMSKSLGNFFTIREILQKYDPEVVRFFLLSSHYRSPLNFSDAALEQAKGALTSLYLALRGLTIAQDSPTQIALFKEGDFDVRFAQVMDDDFNTVEALAVLFDLAHELNRVRAADPPQAIRLGALLRCLGGVLGLLQRDPEAFLQGGVTGTGHAVIHHVSGTGTGTVHLSAEQIEDLIERRTAARRRTDWAEADCLREQLTAHGIVLEDGAGGTTWRRQ
ncbi:MAG: cysteine--tRNA ligase [Gammaproteobacteria bacterium]|nr:MAG: cysteine--tRNA ligase [Gammaproteobacteria bacterium]